MTKTPSPTHPDTLADLAAMAAADRITAMWLDEAAGPVALAAGYAVAVATIEAVAPFGSKDAADRLDDAIDVILDGWDYNGEIHRPNPETFLLDLAEGLGM
jgi:hypothetical protein